MKIEHPLLLSTVTICVQTERRDLISSSIDLLSLSLEKLRYFSVVRYPVVTRSAASLISDTDGLYPGYFSPFSLGGLDGVTA